jgi:hypothetical protein
VQTGRTVTGTRTTGGRTVTGTRTTGGRTVTGTRTTGGRTVTGTRTTGGRVTGTTRGPGRVGTGPGTRGPTRVGVTPGTRGPTRIGSTPGTRGPGRIGTGPRSPGRVTTGPGGRGPGGTTRVRNPGRVTVGPGVRTTGRVVGIRGPTRVVVVRAPRRVWIGNTWRTFVPLAALTGVYLGSTYYAPYGYAAVSRPACRGITEDGCTLQWQDVPLDDGGSDLQCVQYCPPTMVGAAPPPAMATPVPPRVVPAPATVGSVPMAPVAAADADAQADAQVQGCAMTVFAEANFSGISSPVQEDEPKLSEVGWQNEIGSIQIQSGTWEFFADEEYTGDAMRMKPGQYENLGPQWAKRIGSFMCISP